MKLTLEQKQEIMEVVAMSFETGHFSFDNKEDFKRDFEGIKPEAVNAAWEYYCELVNMGPAGFYEEFKDKYDFDPMFVSEYGDADYEEDIDYYTIPVDPSLKEEALRLLYSEEE